MKLYCIKYLDAAAPNGSMFGQTWVGTKADSKAEAHSQHSQGMRNVEQVVVEVPTGKAGLLSFLNDRGVRP